MTKRYDTYKDSGVQWLGEIPGHWGCVRLNKLASLKTGTTPKFFENALNEDTIDWYTPSDFTEEFFLHDSQRRLNRIDFDVCGLNYVPSNSVLIIGIGGTAGKVACNKNECYSNQQITSLIPNERMYHLYMMLYFKSIRNILLETAHYTTLPILNNSFLAGVSLPLPPLSEQHAIVSYLDDKCGKIDEWIEKKQKEVELLGEMKQRVIADAVTRGLNPNVKMKPTNIPWLPEVPEHWDCVKLKMFCQDNKEKNKGNVESCVLSLSYGKVIVKKNINFGLVPENYENYQIVNPGYIILRLTDLQNDHRSLRTGLVRNRGIITSAYVGLVVKNMNSEYTQLLLHSYDVMKVFYGMGGGLRQSMSYNDISNIYIPVPPLSEQHAIVSYITERTTKIDKLVENVNREIENLKEYKQRLISDVVTGQIKVC